METTELFGKEKIWRVLLKLAPPVMLAQLIQALYNIVDSLFVGRYAESGLTALSIVYPLQLLMIALAVGTGVGINTVMAAKLGCGSKSEAEECAGTGTYLAVLIWFLFAAVCYAFMPMYARMSTDSPAVIRDVIVYGRNACVFSFGLFLESIWTKVIQAYGDMKTPMIAQIIGAVTNIVLDPLLIFGMFGLPEMGIAGAAAATVTGQIAAALIVMRKGFRRSPAAKKYPRYVKAIFRLGTPNIIMQATYTFYILGLNLILKEFSDNAVTALGLYYKWQTFFFIPLGAMQTCIVPIISFNYAARNLERCKKTLLVSVMFGAALMLVGTLCFCIFPEPMLRVFTSNQDVIRIGITGFIFTGSSFIPMVTSQIFPVFFQATGFSVKSSLLTIIRTVVLFVPLGYLFSRLGLTWFWVAFPVTEILTTLVGLVFYRKFLEKPYMSEKTPGLSEAVIKPSHQGAIITIAREHGSSGKQIGRLVAERLDIPFYYKEMTALAAKESGLDREFISDINKNSPDYLHDLYLSTSVVRHAVTAQNRIINRIAEEGSCVIVGRAADYVLKDNPNVIRIFIYAPKDYRIGRVMETYGDTKEEAARNIRRSDEARGAYYRNISGAEWGARQSYDLLLDSSIGDEESAEVIEKYVISKQREREKQNVKAVV